MLPQPHPFPVFNTHEVLKIVYPLAAENPIKAWVIHTSILNRCSRLWTPVKLRTSCIFSTDCCDTVWL